MEENKKSKKYFEWMKGAYGTMAMLIVMNLVFVIRALVKKDLNLWLELSVTEFAFKSTSHFEGYDGAFPFWAALVIVLVFSFGLLFLAIRTPKKNSLLIPLTVLYLIDTGFMIFMLATNRFNDFGEASWINVVVHVIMIVLLASGLYAFGKVKKLNNEQTNIEKEEN